LLIPNSSNSGFQRFITTEAVQKGTIFCCLIASLRSRKNLTSSGKRLSPIRPVRQGNASARQITRSHKSSEKYKPVPFQFTSMLQIVMRLAFKSFKNIQKHEMRKTLDESPLRPS